VPPLPSGSTVLVPELGPFFRSNDGVDADSGVTQLYTHLVPNGDGQAVVIIPFEASLALQMHRERERERERAEAAAEYMRSIQVVVEKWDNSFDFKIVQDSYGGSYAAVQVRAQDHVRVLIQFHSLP
jgi:hypothetical protein